MAIRTKKRVLAAAVEAVEGTAETLSASDGGLLVSDVTWDLTVEMVMRDYVTDSLSKVKKVPGRRNGSFSFTTELRGKNAAFSTSNTPELGKYLRACGFGETVDDTAGAETVTYKPTSDPTAIPSLTMALYNDGRRILLKGCRGNVQFEATTGEFGRATFNFQGVIESVADASMLSVDLSGEIGLNPPLLLAASFTLGGYSAKIASLSVDMGNTVALRQDMSSSSGYFSAIVTDRTPTGQIDPELVTESTYPFIGNWLAGTSAAISFNYGSTQYNQVAVSIPVATTQDVADGERDQLAIGTLDFELNTAGSGDDEIEVVFS